MSRQSCKVGIDLAKRSLVATRFDHNGNHEWYRGGTSQEALHDLFSWLRPSDDVFLEAGTQSFEFSRQLHERVDCQVSVLHAGDLPQIYNSLKKTDREDALKIARLAYGYPKEALPMVRIPTREQELLRSLCTERAHWLKQAHMNKCRLHSLFTKSCLTTISKGHLRSKKGRTAAIKKLPDLYQPQAVRLATEIGHQEAASIVVMKEMVAYLKRHSGYAELVLSVPGVGPVTACTLLAYLGDCTSFSDAKQVAYYVGFVPRISISGDTAHYGRIVNRGCRPLRGVMVQAAWSLLRSRHAGELRVFFERVAAQRGRKRAIIALARKMLTVIYTMLQTGELYRDMPRLKLHEKLAKLGITTTGPGQENSAATGPGERKVFDMAQTS